MGYSVHEDPQEQEICQMCRNVNYVLTANRNTKEKVWKKTRVQSLL